jgi:hypothetical protein
MGLFEDWCDWRQVDDNRKRLWAFTERNGGRTAIEGVLAEIMRSHYDRTERIAEDIRELGYEGAAAILAERLPTTRRARSGELGEILATELVEEKLVFRVPVRRLRYKDGREMALRGDDVIGALIDKEGDLYLLKGEAKSRATLAAATIAEARATLSRDNGRPTATSLLFVADRLMDDDDDELVALGRKIRNEVGLKAVSANRIDHLLFTMSGNAPPEALEDDLAAASDDRTHTVVHLRIEDHQDFIKVSYEGALALGDS